MPQRAGNKLIYFFMFNHLIDLFSFTTNWKSDLFLLASCEKICFLPSWFGLFRFSIFRCRTSRRRRIVLGWRSRSFGLRFSRRISFHFRFGRRIPFSCRRFCVHRRRLAFFLLAGFIRTAAADCHRFRLLVHLFFVIRRRRWNFRRIRSWHRFDERRRTQFRRRALVRHRRIFFACCSRYRAWFRFRIIRRRSRRRRRWKFLLQIHGRTN